MSFDAVEELLEHRETGLTASADSVDRLAIDFDRERERTHVFDLGQVRPELFEVWHKPDSAARKPQESRPICGNDASASGTPVAIGWGDMKKGSLKRSAAANHLGQFLAREVGSAKSERQWAAEHGLEPHIVRRARKAEIETRLDTLQEFADRLEVEAWQLLYPGFARGQPDPEVMSEEAVKAAQLINDLPEDKRRAVYAELVRLLEFGRSFASE